MCKGNISFFIVKDRIILFHWYVYSNFGLKWFFLIFFQILFLKPIYLYLWMQSIVYYEDFDNLTFRRQPFDGQWPVVKSPQWLQQIDD